MMKELFGHVDYLHFTGWFHDPKLENWQTEKKKSKAKELLIVKEHKNIRTNSSTGINRRIKKSYNTMMENWW